MGLVTLFNLHVQWIKYISLLGCWGWNKSDHEEKGCSHSSIWSKTKDWLWSNISSLTIVTFVYSIALKCCVTTVASLFLLQPMCCQTDKTGSKWKINLNHHLKWIFHILANFVSQCCKMIYSTKKDKKCFSALLTARRKTEDSRRGPSYTGKHPMIHADQLQWIFYWLVRRRCFVVLNMCAASVTMVM